mgnify:CR=1 FL=1
MADSISVGDLVTHKLSKVQLHDFSKRNKKYSSTPGIVIGIDDKNLLILWDSYTEWVPHAYLLKISKVDQ